MGTIYVLGYEFTYAELVLVAIFVAGFALGMFACVFGIVQKLKSHADSDSDWMPETEDECFLLMMAEREEREHMQLFRGIALLPGFIVLLYAAYCIFFR